MIYKIYRVDWGLMGHGGVTEQVDFIVKKSVKFLGSFWIDSSNNITQEHVLYTFF